MFTKKIGAVILCAVILLGIVSCSIKKNNQTEAPQEVSDNLMNAQNSSEVIESSDELNGVTIRVGAMTGPTGMGMVKLISENDSNQSQNKYEFTIAGTADEIAPLLVKGDLDIAAVPINLASILYNNSDGQVQLLAINTLGVLYILDNDGQVSSINDLKGKTIYATGKGSTPEYTLRYLLTENGIEPDNDITIEWKSEPAEIVSLFKSSTDEIIAMLPQPYVTVAQNSVQEINVALDLTEEWKKLDNGSECLTGCLVIGRQFAEKNPEAVASFIDEYAASVEWVNENIDDAAGLMEQYGIVKAAVAEKAIPYCNITCLTESDLSLAEQYLSILYNQNPKAIGGCLPDEGFYYHR